MWRWMTALFALAILISILPDLVLKDALTQGTWWDFHRRLGQFALTSALCWLILFAICYRRYGKRTLWALLALPIAIYWGVLWLIAPYPPIMM